MKIPSSSFFQYFDQEYFYDYKINSKQEIVCRIYLAHEHLLKRVVKSSDFSSLNVIFPIGTTLKDQFSFILQQGYLPSFSAPSGFAITKKKSDPVDENTFKLDMDLYCLNPEEESQLIPLKEIPVDFEVCSQCQVSPFLFVVGFTNGIVSLFNPQDSFQHLLSFKAHSQNVANICSIGDFAFSTSSLGEQVKIWELTESNTVRCIGTIGDSDEMRTHLVSDSKYIVTGSVGKKIKFWPTTNPGHTPDLVLSGHGDVVDLLFEHSPEFLLSYSFDSTIKIWDRTKQFGCVRTIAVSDEETIVDFHFVDSQKFAYRTLEGKMNIVELSSGKLLESRDMIKRGVYRKILSNGVLVFSEKNKIILYRKKPPLEGEALKSFYLNLLEEFPGFAALYNALAALCREGNDRASVYIRAALHFLHISDFGQAKQFYAKAIQECGSLSFVKLKPYLELLKNQQEELFQLCQKLAESYLKTNSISDSIKALRILLSIKKENDHFEKLFVFYQKISKPTKALAVAMQQLDFLRELRRFDEAEAVTRRALELSDNDERFQVALSAIANQKRVAQQLKSFLSIDRETEPFTHSQFEKIQGSLLDQNGSQLQADLQAIGGVNIDQLSSLESMVLLSAFQLNQKNQEAALQSDTIMELEGELQALLDQKNQEATLQSDRIMELEGELQELRGITPSTKIGCFKTLQTNHPVNVLCEIPTGQVVSGNQGGQLQFFNFSNEENRDPISAHQGAVFSLCYHSKGDYLVSGSGDKTIKLWKIGENIDCKFTLEGHQGSIYQLKELLGGELASCSLDNSIKIWELSERWGFNCSCTLNEHTGAVSSILQLSTGLLVSGSYDQTLKFWDPFNQFKCVHTHSGSAPILSLCSLEDDSVAIGYKDGTIDLLETSTYTVIKSLKGHTAPVETLHRPTTQFLFSGSKDHTIRVWDLLEDFKLDQTLGDHTEAVNFLYSHSDGTLLSCSEDKTIKRWSDVINS